MSVSDAPVAVASAMPMSPLDRAKAFVLAAQSAAADGLTWREFGELMVALLRLLIEAIDAAPMMSGQEKKAFVLDAVGRLFDAVADRAVPLAAWPLWMLARPAIRSLVLAIASGAIEQLLPLVRLA
jgi:hypothetical protein